MRTLLVLMSLLLSRLAFATDEHAFDSLYLVLLKTGPKADSFEPARLEELQKQHLAHLTKLTEQGVILVAGPFDEQDDETMRGMCLFRADSKDEARKLAEADPAVEAGRLAVEIQRWWFQTQWISFPMENKPVPPKAD